MSNDQKTELFNTSFLREKNGIAICRKHPQYLGIRSPRVDCAGCQTIYNIKNKNINENG